MVAFLHPGIVVLRHQNGSCGCAYVIRSEQIGHVLLAVLTVWIEIEHDISTIFLVEMPAAAALPIRRPKTHETLDGVDEQNLIPVLRSCECVTCFMTGRVCY